MSDKMSFWAVFALVIGSQIGSGVFMLPTNLAPFGWYGLIGWGLSGIGAMTLAMVFAQLCSWFPKTGGPHVYIEQAFGKLAAFFVGWTYWVISWISSTVVVIASISYLMPLIGDKFEQSSLYFEIVLIVLITALNCIGVAVASYIEFLLTLLKFVPLCVISCIALFYFDVSNFVLDPSVSSLPLSQILSRVTLLTLWGFIGLESATTPAESVENPSKTIAKAIPLGTFCVALLYFINSMAIMGIIPGDQLMHSQAPYADASRIIFGGNWHLVISSIACVVCIGTLNAWTLTSGQIALGLAQDRLLPLLFGYKNRFGAPYWSLIISCLGIIPLLFLTSDQHVAEQILIIIDLSVIAFLFVYVCSCLAFLKVLRGRAGMLPNYLAYLYGIVALFFCSWVIYETPVQTIMMSSLFTLSGIPCYIYYWYNNKE